MEDLKPLPLETSHFEYGFQDGERDAKIGRPMLKLFPRIQSPTYIDGYRAGYVATKLKGS